MSVEPPLMRDVLNGVLNSRVDASGLFSSFPTTQLTPDELTAGVTIVNFAYDPYDFRRYGCIADGTTDNTSVMVSVLTAFAAFSGAFYAAPNLKFTRVTVNAAIPLRAAIIDDSFINAWNTAGFRQKITGIFEGADPTAVNDYEQILASSGHNASCGLDNRGTAASSSGLARIASFHWYSGQLTKQVNEEGFRDLARWEWANLQATTRWFWAIRRGVPWEARDWEFWYTAKPYTTGDYVRSSVGIYKATTTGTSGATEPTHLTGTVSDGGVSWLAILPNLDSAIFSVDQHGQIATNTAPANGAVAYLKADRFSPGAGQANLYIEADGVSQLAVLRIYPTDGAGAVAPGPVILAQSGVGLRVLDSTTTIEFARMSDTNYWQFTSACQGAKAELTYSASMTPDANLANAFTIRVTNGTAFTINAPTHPLDGRKIKFQIRNQSGGVMGAITLNAVYKTAGAFVAPANANNRSIEFEYDGSSNGWVECARTAADAAN